jgi:hypothetical protein
MAWIKICLTNKDPTSTGTREERGVPAKCTRYKSIQLKRIFALCFSDVNTHTHTHTQKFQISEIRGSLAHYKVQ